MTKFKVGEIYNVTCAEIVMDDGRNYFIPVFEHLHADAQFGFPHQHYHIDGRFELHPRMRHHFGLNEGHTNAVIVLQEIADYHFVRLVNQDLKCIRLNTCLVIPEKPNENQQQKIDLYRQWYEGYIGKFCIGRKCPHFGTEMLEHDGMLVCPMHGLRAHLKSLKIINITAIYHI